MNIVAALRIEQLSVCLLGRKTLLLLFILITYKQHLHRVTKMTITLFLNYLKGISYMFLQIYAPSMLTETSCNIDSFIHLES